MTSLQESFIVLDGVLFVHHPAVKRPVFSFTAGMLWPGWMIPEPVTSRVSSDFKCEPVNLPADALEALRESVKRQFIAGLTVELRVLDFLERQGRFYAGCREEIADEICVTRVMVKRAVNALGQAGLLQQVTNARAGSLIELTRAGVRALAWAGVLND